MSHRKHLSKDKRLKSILTKQDEMYIETKKHIHLVLCSSIMSQQLSVKVAAVINQRFLNLFENRNPKPAEILAIPFDTLRAIGLSHAKTNYVRNVCDFFIQEKLNDKKLLAMDRHEVLRLLTQIKGVGNWTVEMLLMFALGQEDVFAPDDLGIQQAMIKLYGLEHHSKKELKSAMQEISSEWSPYRTYACLYLWGWKDKKP